MTGEACCTATTGAMPRVTLEDLEATERLIAAERARLRHEAWLQELEEKKRQVMGWVGDAAWMREAVTAAYGVPPSMLADPEKEKRMRVYWQRRAEALAAQVEELEKQARSALWGTEEIVNALVEKARQEVGDAHRGEVARLNATVQELRDRLERQQHAAENLAETGQQLIRENHALRDDRKHLFDQMEVLRQDKAELLERYASLQKAVQEVSTLLNRLAEFVSYAPCLATACPWWLTCGRDTPRDSMPCRIYPAQAREVAKRVGAETREKEGTNVTGSSKA